jgi:transposase
MLPFSFSQADADCVNIERKTQTNPLIRNRMQVLHLLHLGYKKGECAKIVGCHANSVTNYIKMYLDGGLEAIRQLNYSFARHELGPLYEQVEQVLDNSDCSTVGDVREILKAHFAYERSQEAVRQLLHRLGYKRRKTGTFPGRFDNFDEWQAKQDKFVEKLQQLIQQADNDELDLVFGDAAHFVYGKFNNYCWGRKVRYSPSGHGRYRINVYGVYDVVNNQVCSMYNEGYIDADFIVEYLNWLRENIYRNEERPLHIVMDNARYQHCKYVKACAEDRNIVLEFLPGYSPNLNLIERLWKYMKGILAKKYHKCKQTFEKAIVELLENLNYGTHQENLKTLLNPIFQRFEKSQILPW